MATNAQEFAELTVKRNNILVDCGVVLPYNNLSSYSYVTTTDGCEIWFPLFNAEDKEMVDIQKSQMNDFLDRQAAEQEAMATIPDE